MMLGDAHPIEAHFVGERGEFEPLIVALLGDVGIAQGGRDGRTLEVCFGAGVVRAAQQGSLHWTLRSLRRRTDTLGPLSAANTSWTVRCSLHAASAASSVKPPAKTDRRLSTTRSGSLSKP